MRRLLKHNQLKPLNIDGGGGESQQVATLNRDNISKHNRKMKGNEVEEPTEEPPAAEGVREEEEKKAEDNVGET